MISKTQLKNRIETKTNPELVETLKLCKDHKAWYGVGQILSWTRKERVEVNLSRINNEAKAGEVIVVPGKVLSQGDLDKKIKIVALKFSESAKEKLDKAKIEYSFIFNEIKKNPEAKGIKVLR